MTHRLGFGLLAIAALGLVMATADDAQAFGRRNGSGGSHGGYASNGGNGSFGSHGSRGGLFSRLRGNGSNGSHGGYGSNGGHGSCGSHGGNGGYHENGHHHHDGDRDKDRDNGQEHEAGYRGEPQGRDLNRNESPRQAQREEQPSLPSEADRQ